MQGSNVVDMVSVSRNRKTGLPIQPDRVSVWKPGRLLDRVALVIPTLNAGSGFAEWLKALKSQSVVPERTILVDSSSTDNTVSLALKAGFEVRIIRREDFSHGGTRQAVVDTLDETDIVVFLTQDAFLAEPDSLANLLEAFEDASVAAAYGRQLPRRDADPIEAHARLFNYTSQSYVRGSRDIPRHGIKTSFISNSFGAWRRSALQQIGGFPSHTIQNEDAWATSRLIKDGWRVAYCANAPVHHSHGYTPAQEFRRYFDIGVFHARDSWIRKEFGQAENEGLKYVKSELKYLGKTHPELIPSAVLRTAMKLVGYKLGSREEKLPLWLKKRWSSNIGFWTKNNNGGK